MLGLSKISCLNPMEATFLQGTRLHLVCVAMAQECGWLRTRLAETADRSRHLRVIVLNQGGFLMCWRYRLIDLQPFQLQVVSLLAVHTEVTLFDSAYLEKTLFVAMWCVLNTNANNYRVHRHWWLSGEYWNSSKILGNQQRLTGLCIVPELLSWLVKSGQL